MPKVLTLTVLVSLAMLAACDRRDEGTPAGKYNRDYDGTPTMVEVPCDPLILADQRKLSGGAPARTGGSSGGAANPGGSTGGSAAPPAPTGSPRADAKATLGRMAATIDSSPAAAANFFHPDVRAAMGALFAASARVTPKIEKLQSRVTEKLQTQMPPELGMPLMMVAAMAEIPQTLAKIDPDAMTYTVVNDEKVEVTGGPMNKPLVFVKSAGVWLIAGPQGAAIEKIRQVPPMMNKMSGVLDTLIEGIEDGNITSENFAARAKELTEGMMGPTGEPGPASGIDGADAEPDGTDAPDDSGAGDASGADSAW